MRDRAYRRLQKERAINKAKRSQIGKSYGDDFDYGRIADHLKVCSCWMCSPDGHGEESYQVTKANADAFQQLKEIN
jgi:hypothetical protein|tara:strand:- start:200 stop:427 length:228 start_codon:yes stop_codon:yes gene_type:complete